MATVASLCFQQFAVHNTFHIPIFPGDTRGILLAQNNAVTSSYKLQKRVFGSSIRCYYREQLGGDTLRFSSGLNVAARRRADRHDQRVHIPESRNLSITGELAQRSAAYGVQLDAPTACTAWVPSGACVCQQRQTRTQLFAGGKNLTNSSGALGDQYGVRRWQHLGTLADLYQGRGKGNFGTFDAEAVPHNASRSVSAHTQGVGADSKGSTGGDLTSKGHDGSVVTGDGSHLYNTMRLVETAMLAAAAGLAFFLSSLLRLDSYFGAFFPLPVVISSIKWGAAAGRKTMVATSLLLFVLSGPLRAVSYLARAVGLLLYVMLTSWLVRQDLFGLVVTNAHSTLSLMLASVGSNIVPSVPFVCTAAVALVLVNCAAYAILLHVIYAVFLNRLGFYDASRCPPFLRKALS
eukprot:jgi/Mesen1/381/ME000010S_10841